MNENFAKRELIETIENERKIEKLKFCIIRSFKSQACINNLLLFTLDNPI